MPFPWSAAKLPAVHLEGVQTILRVPEERDWAEWASLRERSRAFLTPWEPAWPPAALERATWERHVSWLRRRRRLGSDLSWLICERKNGVLVGGASLNHIRWGVAQTALLGYWIGEPYAGRGLAHDGVCAVLAYGFGVMGLHRIEAACLPNNVRSQAVLDRIGFRFEGIARGYLKINGFWRDHLIYAQLAEDKLP